MDGEVRVSRDRFLAFARRLALLSGCAAAPLYACGGASSGSPPPEGPKTDPSSSASGTGTSVATGSPTSDMPKDGPCRCSWDTNANAAPRVCKKGEENYEGVRCIPGSHPSYEGGYYGPIKGPLPPPDLPA